KVELILKAQFLQLHVELQQFYLIRRTQRISLQRSALNQKFAELELRALQAQMNPHFIFNALHAIQDFIFRKNERVANRYLVKFSRLMRLFLESSKEKYIRLAEEVKLLQLYVELEKLRFEDKFDFQINISQSLATSMIEIPSMLLQPFVENAINHGLVHRESNGLLRVDFALEERTLHCTIEDNGIGRQRAMEIKSQSIKSYKSRGMQLVEERQRVWKIIGKAAVDIHITDLRDAAGEARGTRVDIRIKLDD
ncbi:MAG: histidine kinase, partial [Bacteroidota bacterium]